jgi:hypothetical protein
MFQWLARHVLRRQPDAPRRNRVEGWRPNLDSIGGDIVHVHRESGSGCRRGITKSPMRLVKAKRRAATKTARLARAVNR